MTALAATTNPEGLMEQVLLRHELDTLNAVLEY